MAPETILSMGHDRSVDLWALGIAIFEILCGVTPFAGGSPMETYENIVQYEDYSKHNRTSIYAGSRASCANRSEQDNLPWHICDNNIDIDARNIVRGLLLKSKRLRLGGRSKTLDSLIHHQFFESIDWDALAAQQLEENMLPHHPPAFDVSGFETKPEPLRVHVTNSVGGEDGYFIEKSGWMPEGFKSLVSN